MIIADILTDKGPGVTSVTPGTTIATVAQRLAREGISSAVVMRGGYAAGIVTDRLIVDALAEHGAAALSMRADEAMLSPAPVCRPHDTIRRCMQVMTDRRVRHLLVVGDAGIDGIVSIGDLVKFRIRDAELENGVLRDLVPAWALHAVS